MRIVCPSCQKHKIEVTPAQVGTDIECPCGVAFTLERRMLSSAKGQRAMLVSGVIVAVLLLGGAGAWFVFMPGKAKPKPVAVEEELNQPPTTKVVVRTAPEPETKPAPVPAAPAPKPVPAPVPATPAAPASGLAGLAKVHRFASLAAVDGFTAPNAPGWILMGLAASPVKLDKRINQTASCIEYKWGQDEVSRAKGFTAAVLVKMLATDRTDNCFVIWLDDGAPGCKGGMLRIYPDKVTWGRDAKAAQVLLTSDNTDAMHEFRLAALAGGYYAVWRDGVKVGDRLGGDVAVRKKSATFGAFTIYESCSAIVGGLAVDPSGVKAP